MARKPFLLRMDPEVFDDLQRWADDDLRSLNGQIEYLRRAALRDRRRGPRREPTRTTGPEPDEGA